MYTVNIETLEHFYCQNSFPINSCVSILSHFHQRIFIIPTHDNFFDQPKMTSTLDTSDVSHRYGFETSKYIFFEKTPNFVFLYFNSPHQLYDIPYIL